MKLCYWTVFPNTYQTALLRALRAAGADVVACYFKKYDAGRVAMGWKERTLEGWEFQVASVDEARRRINDFDERTQVVGAFFNLTYWRLALYCIRHRVPWIVLTERSSGSWKTRPIQWMFARLVARYAVGLLGIGNTAVAQFRKLGVPEEKLVWTTYATPGATNEEAVSREGTKGTKGLSTNFTNSHESGRGASTEDAKATEEKSIVFVFAGALIERKGVDVLGMAFKDVHAKYSASRLLVIGDGPLRKCLSGEGVEFVGAVAQDRVTEIMARGDVIVLPSRYDAWGLALVEGAACGLAMIGSDRTEAAKDLIRDGENGYLAATEDVAALAAAMERYAADPGLVKKHGAAARIAAAKTSPEACAKRLMEMVTANREVSHEGTKGTKERETE